MIRILQDLNQSEILSNVTQTVLETLSDLAANKTSHQPEYGACTYDGFHSGSDQCEIALHTCKLDEKYDLVNYLGMLYCDLGGQLWLFVIIGVIIIYLIFKFVSATVEEYIAPGITYITEAMKISESMAAVTLLALANGAGDVITAIVAGGAPGSAGINYDVGALYGAGFFVCAMVIFLTIRSSPQEIRVDASTFYRDIGMYIVATVTTILFAWIGKLTVTTSIIFLLEYVALVVIVYFQDRAEASKKKQNEEIQSLLPSEHQEKKVPTIELAKKKLGPNLKIAQKLQAAVRKLKLQGIVVQKMKKRLEERLERSASFSELSILAKIDFILLYPFEIIRKLTMPPCEEDQYNKRYVIIWPFGGLLFALWAFRVEYIYWLYLGLPLMIIMSLAFYFTQQKAPMSQIPSYFWLITSIGTIWGLLWTYIATTILIDLLNAFIVVFKLNNTYMGLTVLGIGNALPDALTTIALAKEGYAQMGITGSYAGQLFGLLVGFGLAMLKLTLSRGPQDFTLFSQPKESLLDLLVIFLSLINLVLSFVVGICRKYLMDAKFGWMIGIIYIVFFVVATGVQIYYLASGTGY